MQVAKSFQLTQIKKGKQLHYEVNLNRKFSSLILRALNEMCDQIRKMV